MERPLKPLLNPKLGTSKPEQTAKTEPATKPGSGAPARGREKPTGESKHGEKKPAADQPKPKKRRRWLVRLAILLVLLGGLAYIAPWIIAKTPLRQQILPLALAKFNGSFELGEASLDWFSPVELKNLTIRDPQGQTLATIASIATDRPLWSLALQRTAPLTVTIDGPQLAIELRPDGSNLEDAIAELLKEPSQGGGGDIKLVVTGGKLETKDTVSQKRWVIDGVQISAAIPASKDSPLSLDFKSTVPVGAASIPLEASIEQAAQNSFRVKSGKLPLDLFQPLLRRFAPGVEIAGEIGCDIAGTIDRTGDAPKIQAKGSIDGEHVQLVSTLLAPDQLRLPAVLVAGEFSLAGQQLTIPALRIESDVAQAKANGTIDLSKLGSGGLIAILRAFAASSQNHVDGNLNLAKLAQLLPNTVRVREGLRIEAGHLNFQLDSVAANNAPGVTANNVLQAKLFSTELVASSGGQKITWDQPINVNITARQAEQSLLFEQVECRSSFLTVIGGGTLENAKLSLRGDLDKLAAELSRFFDLRGMTLAGKLAGEFAVATDNQNVLTVKGTASVNDFAWIETGRKPWRESNLQITLASTAQLENGGLKQISIAEAKLLAGGDACTVLLKEPVVNLLGKDMWPLELSLQGDVATWSARLEPWVPMSGADLRGKIDARVAVTGNQQKRNVGWTIDLRDLVVGPSLIASRPVAAAPGAGAPVVPGAPTSTAPWWTEKQLLITGDADFEPAFTRLTIREARIRGELLSVVMQGMFDDLAKRRDFQLNGRIAYEAGDLVNKLRPWLGPGVQLAGKQDREFRAKGTLGEGAAWAKTLAAELSLGWDSGSAYGFVLERGEAHARIAAGIGELAIRDVGVSSGRFNCLASVDLNQPKPILVVAKGTIIDRVKLSPELCKSGIKYIAPALANATKAEGLISIQLGGANVPLDDPQSADISGVLAIHRAVIKPEGMAAQLTEGAAKIRALLLTDGLPKLMADGALLHMTEQNVEFRMVQKRVYHRNLRFQIGDIGISTYGSVGLDQTLAIMTEIPLLDAWLKDRPKLTGLKGEIVKLPVQGSFADPKIDLTPLRDLGIKILGGGLMDKLLRPRE